MDTIVNVPEGYIARKFNFTMILFYSIKRF